MLRIDGRCDSQCGPAEYADEKGICRACHYTCDGCLGPAQADCKACSDKQEVMMTESGLCVDCLNDSSSHPLTCPMSVLPRLVKPTSDRSNKMASLTLQISFPQDDQYVNKIGLEILKESINVRIDGICHSDFAIDL